MRKEKFLFRVLRAGDLPPETGVLCPANSLTQTQMRDKGYRVGDHLHGTLAKPRNPGFHALMHAFGHMVVDNVEAFEYLDAHSALKRLQIESGVGCEEMALNMPGVGPCNYRVPKSLSYSSMDQGEAEQLFSGLCAYVVKRYWPTLTERQVKDMAEVMAQ